MVKKLTSVLLAFVIFFAGYCAFLVQAEIEPNPQLNTSCGIDMVLVIDSSNSINDTELTQMLDAYEVFVHEFLPGTASLIGVVEFDTEATIQQDFTDNVTELIDALNAANSDGFTNWQDALAKAHSMFDPRPDKPDLIIFASDGNPNRRGSPAVMVNQAEAVSAAVAEANGIKMDGIRIITLAIGDNLNTGNLEAISSADAVIESDFGTLAGDLAELAGDLCGGTITVKKTVNETGVPGFEFSVDVDDGVGIPGSGLTDGAGYINFDIEFNGTNTSVDVLEAAKAGYSLEHAECKIGDVVVGTFDSDDSVDGIVISQNDIVSCIFANSLVTFCGDEVVDPGETCDLGANNTDVPCLPGYGSSCYYCNTTCQELMVLGPYCGDGEKNGPEQCDGTDGVGPHQTCTAQCELVNLTFCGDGIMQTPNGYGFNESCDGTDGVGPHQTCTLECELIDLTFCGDGIMQSPNDEGTGGPGDDGYEQCDGMDGVGQNETCTAECVLSNMTYCGDGIMQTPNDYGLNESCDGTDGIGPHQTCTAQCELLNLTFCGDGIKHTPNDDGFNESCDGTDGVGPYQTCTAECTLVDLTFCGDGIKQTPNDYGFNESCDGTDGVGPHQTCTLECELNDLTYCGDGIMQSPNDEGTEGPAGDGYEQCDGSDGVGVNQVCTASCVLEYLDDGCMLTQGYWKNHDWPSTSQYQRDDLFFNSGMTWYEVLKAPPKKGDAYLILAHQYIAFMLNGENGAAVPGDPASEAEGYFQAYNPLEVPKGEREDVISLAGLLDEYNNGRMGIPHCDD